MVEQASGQYVVTEVGRIDTRYYMIKVHGRYYIMDCASPRDPRNYLLLTSEKARTQWAIYDVTETREKYHCRPPSWAERQTSKLPVAIGAIIYNICIFYLPKSLNIGRLTYDPRILEHWRLIPLLFLLGYIGIALWYNVKYKGSIQFEPEKTYLLKRVKKPNGKKTKLSQTTKGTICLVILLPMSMFIGIIGSNYALLLETTFLFPYVCLFSRFGGFPDLFSNHKFQILVSQSPSQ